MQLGEGFIMSTVVFDSEFASANGIVEAILFEAIVFDSQMRSAQGQGLDNKISLNVTYWMKVLPFLTKPEVESALKNLISKGIFND